MTKYKCLCGFETSLRGDITRHIKRKTPCSPNLESVTVDDLCIERTRKIAQDLSNLTLDEKINLNRERTKKRNLNKYKLNGRTEIEFANYLLSNMIQNSKKRNYDIPELNKKDILIFLHENNVYKANTSLGVIEIPLILSNGHFNSASIDRIDNKKGYLKDNIKVIPLFLNTNEARMSKILQNDWNEIIKIREYTRDMDTLQQIADTINNNPISTSMFYRLSHSAYKHSIQSNITYDFKLKHELMKFLVEKFVEQAGRCKYLNVPLSIGTDTCKYKMSIERINPNNGYTRNNIALIISSLNGQPAGKRKNEDAVKTGALGMNIDKLNEWTFLTKNIMEKIEKIKDKESDILTSLINFNKFQDI